MANWYHLPTLSSAYVCSWATTSFSNGMYTIVAAAKDAAGNSASASATVTVSNIR